MTSFCNVCIARRGNTAGGPAWRELDHTHRIVPRRPLDGGLATHTDAPAPSGRTATTQSVGGHVDKAIQAMTQRLEDLPNRHASPCAKHFSDVTSQLHEEDKSNMDFLATLRHQDDSGCGGASGAPSTLERSVNAQHRNQRPWKPWPAHQAVSATVADVGSLSPRPASSASRSEHRTADNYHRADSPVARYASGAAGGRAGVVASSSSSSSLCGLCRCSCHHSLRKMEADVSTMSEYVDLIRAGFLDLCEAVRADIHDVHTEMDGRFHRQEQRLLEAVRNAVRQEGRYHDLLDRERQEAAGQVFMASHMNKALGQVQTNNELSVQDLYKQLKRLELRLEASESVYHRRQDDGRAQDDTHRNGAALPTALRANVGVDADAVEQHQRIRHEMASVSTHVHALTGAHQQLIQTMVDDRCAKVEHRLHHEVDKLGVQLAELRSRVNAQHRELREHHYQTCGQGLSGAGQLIAAAPM